MDDLDAGIEFGRIVAGIAGHKLKEEYRYPFLIFHRFITGDPLPEIIDGHRNSEKNRRWYNRLTNGILGDVQNALSCVYYHQDNLMKINEKLVLLLDDYKWKELASGSSIAGGNTIAMDAEYQALILAVRRCLEYHTRAMAAYFANDANSFSKFGKFLKGINNGVALKLLEVYQEYRPKFDGHVVSTTSKSTRDLLSHYEYISPGIIHVRSDGFMIYTRNGMSKNICDVVTELTNSLQDYLNKSIEEFVKVASK